MKSWMNLDCEQSSFKRRRSIGITGVLLDDERKKRA